MTNFMFDLPKDQASIIKVIGVGGGGSNAVNHMFNQGIHGVNYVVCNTDAQALELSPIPNKIQLGPELTEGLGAGSNPEQGRLAAEESIKEIQSILSKNTKMVFVTACMGGGTGTGAAPVVARLAREMGILTVGIATLPFSFEGRRKYQQAITGIANLKSHVDTMLLISNDKVREMYGNLSKSEAFNHANNILTTAAKSISEIITIPGEINVDFADVKFVMENGGSALMGCATAEGPDRAMIAVRGALSSPLLNDNDIRGARKFLVNISSGSAQVTIDEITEINEFIQESAKDTDIIFGTCDDASLGDKISVTIIATGFDNSRNIEFNEKVTKIVHDLNAKTPAVEVHNMQEEPTSQEIVVKNLETPQQNLFNHTTTVEEDGKVVEQLELNTETELVVDFQDDFTEETTENNDLITEWNIRATESENTVDLYFNEAEAAAPVEEVNEEPVFEVKEERKEEEFITYTRTDYVPASEPARQPAQESLQDIDDRKKALLRLSFKSGGKTSSLTDLESTPAYLRQGIEIRADQQPSVDSGMSRFSVGESSFDSDKPEIRRNNSFLHDNVD